MPSRVNPRKNEQSENTAVTCHSAIPDSQDAQWIGCEHLRPVENHITESPANENAEQRCIKGKVGDLSFGQGTVAFSREPLKQVKSSNKSAEIGHSVPADSNLVVKPDEEGIEVMNVVGKPHGASKLASK